MNKHDEVIEALRQAAGWDGDREAIFDGCALLEQYGRALERIATNTSAEWTFKLCVTEDFEYFAKSIIEVSENS